MSKQHRVCVICGLQEKRSQEKIFYARFPLDEYRCKQWVQAVGYEDLVHVPIEKLHSSRFVCQKHFLQRDFTKSKTRLKKRAVPRLLLSKAPLTEEQLAEFPLHTKKNPHDAHCALADHSYYKLLDERSAVSNQKSPSSEHLEVMQQMATEVEPLAPSTSQQIVPTISASTSINIAPVKPSKRLHPILVPAAAAQLSMPSTSQQPASMKLPKKFTCVTLKRKREDDSDATPRKRKLLKDLRKTKCTLASLKKSAATIENLPSPVLKEFVLCAVRNRKKKPQGKRWTTLNKISALAIFKRSPKAYRYLQHIIPLPTVKTLQNVLKKIPLEPGINEPVLNQVKKVASKKILINRFCVLAFDEMALKTRLVYNVSTDKVEGFVDLGGQEGRKNELADHALVFLLQGIREKFKQPLAFYFTKGTISSEKLAVLIKDIISAVSDTGLNIIATVCDQGPTNLGALKFLKEWYSGEENYFFINSRKIHIIYDVPHLFKSLRNNFLKNKTIVMDGKVGRWEHLEEMEKKNRSFLYLAKVTPSHVNPKYRQKMRVKYAAQILSQTVAAVLKLMSGAAENINRSTELLQTALVVEELNRLFDFTNGPSSPDDVKIRIRQNVSVNTDHVNVWFEFRKKLETVKFLNPKGDEARNVRCIDGYITTLKSLRDIWEFLKESGFKFLNLRQLNQDALENLFGIIRQHSPTNKHPTCSTFMGALKSSIVSGMTAHHSKSANCEKDLQKLLTDFHDIVFNEDDPSASVSTADLQNMNTQQNDQVGDFVSNIPTIHLPEEDLELIEIESDLAEIDNQPLVYVSGYIAATLIKNQNCSDCKNSLSVNSPIEDNHVYDYIKLREWWKEKKCLTYPSINLCRTVERAMNVFNQEVINSLHVLNICQWVVTLFYSNCDTKWLCQKHANTMAHTMFVRLALLFIRRQCARINLSLSEKEEALADMNKKAQQMGTAK